MNHPDKYAFFQLTGWILFLICVFLFLYAAVRDRDLILVLASLFFLAGCVAFLIPLIFPAAAGKDGPMKEKGTPRRGKNERP